MKFVFEAVFVVTILTAGTFVGCLIAIAMPILFPTLILYKRYGERHGETD